MPFFSSPQQTPAGGEVNPGVLNASNEIANENPFANLTKPSGEGSFDASPVIPPANEMPAMAPENTFTPTAPSEAPAPVWGTEATPQSAEPVVQEAVPIPVPDFPETSDPEVSPVQGPELAQPVKLSITSEDEPVPMAAPEPEVAPEPFVAAPEAPLQPETTPEQPEREDVEKPGDDLDDYPHFPKDFKRPNTEPLDPAELGNPRGELEEPELTAAPEAVTDVDAMLASANEKRRDYMAEVHHVVEVMDDQIKEQNKTLLELMTAHKRDLEENAEARKQLIADFAAKKDNITASIHMMEKNRDDVLKNLGVIEDGKITLAKKPEKKK